jgi:hypothetical protein
MIESAHPKQNRFKHAAKFLGALAVVALPSVGLTAVAAAEPRVWDIEAYDNCMAADNDDSMGRSINDERAAHLGCCVGSGGVFIDDGYLGKCVAPPAEPASQGSRQLPGNAQIPPGIATVPTVTKAPLRPIRVPSDIATASAVSQAPG